MSYRNPKFHRARAIVKDQDAGSQITVDGGEACLKFATCVKADNLFWEVVRGHLSLSVLLISVLLNACTQAAGPPSFVEIKGTPGNYQLIRDGAPYQVRGAGAVPGSLKQLKAFGANSIRTWHVDDALLDEAAALGLTVSVCLDVGRERLGFDYSDAAAVAAQLARLRSDVTRVKDHPALLTWIIGNELNLNASNPLVWDAVNDIAKMIHEVDPNHPVTTALAGFSAKDVSLLKARAPELDFLSTQVYGGIMGLRQAIETLGITKPIMITEWGTKGHWEVPQTVWGAPIELSSTKKAEFYLDGHRKAIASNPGVLIGSYAFLWGQKQERTPTWYGTLSDSGAPTEAADALAKIWTGNWPSNRSPSVDHIRINGSAATNSVYLEPGSLAEATVVANDPESEVLEMRWTLRLESESEAVGGDRETLPAMVPDRIVSQSAGQAMIRAPSQTGAYRLYVEVFDVEGHMGHANFPFYVK